MELFCGCNSNYSYESLNWTHNRTQFDSRLDNKCDICEYWPWHDSDHENMMFDLRNMNITG